MSVAKALLCLLATIPAAAQVTVPVSREPRHHFQFENASVRVYDVVVPPGDTTFFHIHAVDYTYVSIGAANLVAQLAGADAAPLVLRDGEVRFTGGPITHRVWNVGNAPFHNLTIELLSHDSVSEAHAPQEEPGDSVMVDNDRVHVVRKILLPGATAHVGGRELEVYLASGRVVVRDAAQEQRLNVQPGTFRWYAASAEHVVRNIGSTSMTFVTFSVR
jgi:mannose-6-phosphate isomerase-like protein (cupin superfamily)